MTKSELLQKIFGVANELEEISDFVLAEFDKDEEDYNKIDLFWIEQLKIISSNIHHLSKKFNDMDEE